MKRKLKRKRQRRREEVHLLPSNPEKVTKARGGWTDEDRKEYALLKVSQQSYLSYILAHHPENSKLHEQLLGCGNFLEVANFYTIDERRLLRGFTCKKHLHCLMCAKRRACRYSLAFREILEQLLSQEQYSHVVPCLATFTIKNQADLLAAFLHLEASLKKLQRNRRNVLIKGRLNHHPTIFRYVLGGAGSYEIKRGSGSGQWHVHFHMIILLDARNFHFKEFLEPAEIEDGIQMYRRIYRPLDFENQLRSEWLQITGDSHVIDVRALYPRHRYANLQAADDHSINEAFIHPEKDDDMSLFSGCAEAFKYALSSDGISDEDRYEAAETLKERHLIRRFGLLYNIQLPETEADLLDLELRNLPYLLEYYRFNLSQEDYDLFHSEHYEAGQGPLQYLFADKGKKVNCKRRCSNPDAAFLKEKVAEWVAGKSKTDTPF